MKLERNLSPTETMVMNALIMPMTNNAVRYRIEQAVGKPMPRSTVSTAISNLVRWGLLTKTARPGYAKRAQDHGGVLRGRVMVYSKAAEARR